MNSDWESNLSGWVDRHIKSPPYKETEFLTGTISGHEVSQGLPSLSWPVIHTHWESILQGQRVPVTLLFKLISRNETSLSQLVGLSHFDSELTQVQSLKWGVSGHIYLDFVDPKKILFILLSPDPCGSLSSLLCFALSLLKYHLI